MGQLFLSSRFGPTPLGPDLLEDAQLTLRMLCLFLFYFLFKPIYALCFHLNSKARAIRLNVWTVTSSKFLNMVQMTAHAQMHHLFNVLLIDCIDQLG